MMMTRQTWNPLRVVFACTLVLVIFTIANYARSIEARASLSNTPSTLRTLSFAQAHAAKYATALKKNDFSWFQTKRVEKAIELERELHDTTQQYEKIPSNLLSMRVEEEFNETKLHKISENNEFRDRLQNEVTKNNLLKMRIEKEENAKSHEIIENNELRDKLQHEVTQNNLLKVRVEEEEKAKDHEAAENSKLRDELRHEIHQNSLLKEKVVEEENAKRHEVEENRKLLAQLVKLKEERKDTESKPERQNGVPTALYRSNSNVGFHDGAVPICASFKRSSTHQQKLVSMLAQSMNSHNDPTKSPERFFLHVPDDYDLSLADKNTAEITKLVDILSNNPSIDVVGGFTVVDGELERHCHSLNLCHWALYSRYEYSCSSNNLIRCDKTSQIFVSRSRHWKLLDWSLWTELRVLDFFLAIKANGGVVVTAIDVELKLLSSHQSFKQQQRPWQGSMRFLTKHAVSSMIDRDSSERGEAASTVDLCSVLDNGACDGPLHERVMGGHWGALGTSMPIFMYSRFREAFVESVKFLDEHKVQYHVFGGSWLGVLKFGRLLPWDQGDVDFYVNPDSIGGCAKWIQLLKRWADSKEYKHPHVTGRGGTCAHYGVYAAPRTANVNDPYSMGLVTFSSVHCGNDNSKRPVFKTGSAHCKRVKTVRTKAHGVLVPVPISFGKVAISYYGSVDGSSTAMQHRSHAAHGTKKLVCLATQHRHNCILQSDGTDQIDKCMSV